MFNFKELSTNMSIKRCIFIIIVNIQLFFCEIESDENYADNNNENDNLGELSTCLTNIGQSPFNSNHNETDNQTIWTSLKKIYGGPDEVPKECFKHLNWALKEIPVADYLNMTIGDIEIIEVFGESHGLSVEQMSAIAEKVRLDWANKKPEDYSQYDLIALKQILCFFNTCEIMQIHPDAYKNAASEIGTLRNCNQEIIEAFAKLAILAFGQPESWTKFDIGVIGIVATGLEMQPPNLINSINKKFN